MHTVARTRLRNLLRNPPTSVRNTNGGLLAQDLGVRTTHYGKGGSVLRITPSERQALQLLAQGVPALDVVASLGCDAAGVPLDLAELFARLGAANRADAVATAFRRGLLVSSTTSEVHLTIHRQAVREEHTGDRLR